MDKHTCHAVGCKVVVPPRLLMCGRHWIMVPDELKTEVYRYYHPGQEKSKVASKEYLQAARNAIDHVLRKETEMKLRRKLNNGDAKISLPVMSACCKQCLTTPNRIVDGKATKSIIDECLRKDTWFQCHLGTLVGEDICCRGFYDAFKEDVAIIRVARLFNLVEERNVEEYEKRWNQENEEGEEWSGFSLQQAFRKPKKSKTK